MRMAKAAEKPNNGKDPAQRSMTNEAYDQIQNLIVQQKLKSYELISESDLTRELGLGRTPVREALQKLSFEGFVEVLPRRGILVTPVDVNRQLELLETRRPLEILMVRLAAKRAGTGERENMRRLADELEQAVTNADRARYLDINKAIHRAEAAASGNRFLQSQMEIIHNLSRRFWYSFISDSASFATAAELHAGTLRAIANGDADAAQTSCSELLDVLEKVSREALNRESG